MFLCDGIEIKPPSRSEVSIFARTSASKLGSAWQVRKTVHVNESAFPHCSDSPLAFAHSTCKRAFTLLCVYKVNLSFTPRPLWHTCRSSPLRPYCFAIALLFLLLTSIQYYPNPDTRLTSPLVLTFMPHSRWARAKALLARTPIRAHTRSIRVARYRARNRKCHRNKWVWTRCLLMMRRLSLNS